MVAGDDLIGALFLVNYLTQSSQVTVELLTDPIALGTLRSRMTYQGERLTDKGAN